MKTKVGAILLIILATLGFLGTIAAQHGEKEHKDGHNHGPPKTNINRTHIKNRHKPRKYRLEMFPKVEICFKKSISFEI